LNYIKVFKTDKNLMTHFFARNSTVTIEIPTADAIKEKLMQCSFPVDFSTRIFKKILHTVGFCYKRINNRLSIMESERLRVHRTKFIREIRCLS
jgi:hypothetical protein